MLFSQTLLNSACLSYIDTSFFAHFLANLPDEDIQVRVIVYIGLNSQCAEGFFFYQCTFLLFLFCYFAVSYIFIFMCGAICIYWSWKVVWCSLLMTIRTLLFKQFGVSHIFSKELMLLFSKNVLNRSKATVKNFTLSILNFTKFCISKNCCSIWNVKES